MEEFYVSYYEVGIKSASIMDDRAACRNIMDSIYKENPSYWPYGLDMRGLDGGAYLIRKTASDEPVGFVGWQERAEGPRKIGSYAVGVLPEFRKQGFAKKAVKLILQEKAAGVDEVRAYICPHNEASLHLADRLKVPVQSSF